MKPQVSVLRKRLVGMFVVVFWPIILGLVIPGMVPSFSQNSSATEEHLAQLSSQAQTAQQKGDYRTAATCYEEIVKVRPEVAEAWANLGLMQQFLGEYEEANRNFQIALEKNSRLYVPNLFLGLNQLRDHQPAAALRYLREAQRLAPRDEQAAMGLARAYQALHDNIAASGWFTRATEINGTDPDAWYGLGISYLSLQDAAALQLGKLGQTGPYARSLVADAFVLQGRIKDAIDIYNRLLASPVQPPCLLSALGLAYAQQDSDLAQKAFQDELRKNPGCLLARLGLARIALGKADFSETLREAQAAWDGDENFVRMNMHRVWKGVDMDQLGKAAAWIRENGSAQNSLAQFLMRSIESEQAGTGMTEVSPQETRSAGSDNVSSQSPGSLWTEGHYTACEAKAQKEDAASLARNLVLAQCSFYAGDYRSTLAASLAALKKDERSSPALYWQAKSSQELAAAALEQMSIAVPNSSKVHLLMAELHRAREEFSAAETEYTEAIDSDANNVAAHLGLAQVYYEESQDDKALQQLQFVLQADATDANGSFLMGQVLVRRHEYVGAIPYLRTALHGSPVSLPQVHSLLARCLAAQGDYSGALAELKPALASDPTGVFHYQLYQLYQKLGNQEAASAALQESEKLRREEADAEEKRTTTRGSTSHQ